MSDMQGMDPIDRLRIGKKNLRLLTWLAIGSGVLNIVLSAFYWIAIGVLITQLLTLFLTGAVCWLIWQGYRVRWYMFAVMLAAALAYFFQGGQRMFYESADGGVAAYVSVITGLALIGGAVYLGGNEEIDLYLRSIDREGEKDQ